MRSVQLRPFSHGGRRDLRGHSRWRFCDCDGNTLDAVGVCGGTCMMDDNANGICDDIEVEGCTNSTSCNYNADANVDDGSCEGFPTGYCDCFSSVPDTDNDGVCDDDEVDGCDDPFACNYDS